MQILIIFTCQHSTIGMRPASTLSGRMPELKSTRNVEFPRRRRLLLLDQKATATTPGGVATTETRKKALTCRCRLRRMLAPLSSGCCPSILVAIKMLILILIKFSVCDSSGFSQDNSVVLERKVVLRILLSISEFFSVIEKNARWLEWTVFNYEEVSLRWNKVLF